MTTKQPADTYADGYAAATFTAPATPAVDLNALPTTEVECLSLIAALEEKIAILKRPAKIEYPKWVHRAVEPDARIHKPMPETKLVHSKAEEDVLEAGWFDPSAEATKATAKEKK